MEIRMKPSRLRGAVTAPPSKSIAHRLLICAALAKGQSTVRGVSQSEDMCATLACIRALGAQWQRAEACVRIEGGRRGALDGAVFPCRESGSTLRFFLPLALAFGGTAEFCGAARLMERGIGVYESLFFDRGIDIRKSARAVRVSGQLAPGEFVLRGDISSQFVTGLLLALPLLEGGSVIRVLPPVESRNYIDLTLEAMRTFGVAAAETEPNVFSVDGGQRYRAGTVQVEGDWSNAAALLGFNALGGELTVGGLNPESVQGDRVCVSLLDRLSRPGAVIDLSDCPDLGPVLFAVAAAGHGARFTGTRRLQIKESDRARVMAEELRKFGLQAVVGENSVEVPPGTLHAPGETLNGHQDHRIVMALTLLASVTGGEIAGAEAVGKSYPEFFDVLRGVGLEIENAI